VMKDPALIPALLKTKTELTKRSAHHKMDFWRRLYTRQARKTQDVRNADQPRQERLRNDIPFIKICGITNEREARLASELGADILGFVFAPSPRRAEPSLLKKLADLDVLKAGVVVCSSDEGAAHLDSVVSDLLENNLIDAVQFHGSERPGDCYKSAFPYYKAIQVKSAADVERALEYRCPRVLLDAFSPDAKGGTGTRVPSEIVKTAGSRFPLWLAGGIGPDNVREIISNFKPELIDASSKLEASPGVKDPAKLKTFFEEVRLGSILQ